MRQLYSESALAFLAASLLLLPGTIGRQDNPLSGSGSALTGASNVCDAEYDDGDDDNGIQVALDVAEVFFEFNTTDDDLGLQIFLDAAGWKEVEVSDPAGSKIVQITAAGNLSELGITELRFESAEPSPAEVLALFPPGHYEIRANTLEGDWLVSTAEPSHGFLDAPTFSPSNGEEVDPENTVVTWDAPGAEWVEVIIENEESGVVFDVTVTGLITRLSVPQQFLEPDTAYNIEILAIGENGNKTIAESTFVTEP